MPEISTLGRGYGKRVQDRLLAAVAGEGRENCDGAIDEGDDDFLLHTENGIIGETTVLQKQGPNQIGVFLFFLHHQMLIVREG